MERNISPICPFLQTSSLINVCSTIDVFGEPSEGSKELMALPNNDWFSIILTSNFLQRIHLEARTFLHRRYKPRITGNNIPIRVLTGFSTYSDIVMHPYGRIHVLPRETVWILSE